MPMPELNKAMRRAASARQLANIQRQQLVEQVGRIVADQPNRLQSGNHMLLGEDLGQPNRPLWVFLSIKTSAQGCGQAQLVMSGNAAPVRFTQAEAAELSPLLCHWMGEYQFVHPNPSHNRIRAH